MSESGWSPDNARIVDVIERAARIIAEADGLLIAAGAGMGVDSGLPDFRGPEGFWRAYPPYRRLGLRFEELANPRWFSTDPSLAWGFYGHRLRQYRETQPHDGFSILRRWGEEKAEGAFVFTSNVDGQFQAAGFPDERVVECHGSLLHGQCLAGCGTGVFDARSLEVEVDPGTFRAMGPLPSCPGCGSLARPNVLMFGDFGWDDRRSSASESRLEAWLRTVEDSHLAVVELGAGERVPTVRYFSEGLIGEKGARLIRVNPSEPEVPPSQVSIPMGALEAIRAIDRILARG